MPNAIPVDLMRIHVQKKKKPRITYIVYSQKMISDILKAIDLG